MSMSTPACSICMIAGIAGLLLGLFLLANADRRGRRRDVYVEERRDPRDPPAY